MSSRLISLICIENPGKSIRFRWYYYILYIDLGITTIQSILSAIVKNPNLEFHHNWREAFDIFWKIPVFISKIPIYPKTPSIIKAKRHLPIYYVGNHWILKQVMKAHLNLTLSVNWKWNLVSDFSIELLDCIN